VETAKSRKFLRSMLTDLGWPLFWGLTIWVGFYAFLRVGLIDHPLVHRYFTVHPVEYIEAAMFFVGVSALGLKLIRVGQHYAALPKVRLSPIPDGGQPAEVSGELIKELDKLPSRIRSSRLATRLLDAIDFVRRKGNADGIDEHLKYLSDVDATKLQEGNGLVRIIIWATPMLGFLGTVIGITLALGGLNPEMLVESPKQAMDGLLAGLGVAFDTTALALTLSLLLMFLQFLSDQFEFQLVSAVDYQVDVELIGRFQELGTVNDPQVTAVRRMAEAVVQSSENLVQRQAELWQHTIDVAHEHWSRLFDATGDKLKQSLATSLDESIQRHAHELGKIETSAAEKNRLHWDRLQESIVQYAKIVQTQHEEISRQTSVMHEVVAATGDVVQLEQTLNNNLKALSGAKHFEETVMSLAATIHLLNSRLTDNPEYSAPQVELTEKSTKAEGRAA